MGAATALPLLAAAANLEKTAATVPQLPLYIENNGGSSSNNCLLSESTLNIKFLSSTNYDYIWLVIFPLVFLEPIHSWMLLYQFQCNPLFIFRYPVLQTHYCATHHLLQSPLWPYRCYRTSNWEVPSSTSRLYSTTSSNYKPGKSCPMSCLHGGVLNQVALCWLSLLAKLSLSNEFHGPGRRKDLLSCHGDSSALIPSYL